MSVSGLKSLDIRITENGFPSDKTIKGIEKMVLDGKHKLNFLVSCYETSDLFVLSQPEANRLCPLKVIKFYESKLVWKSGSSSTCSY